MRGSKRNIRREKLNNLYTKKYYEQYALASLFLCYDKRLEAFWEEESHLESPDFQSQKLNLGIEVTRAYTPQQNDQLPIINNYFCKNYDPKFVKKDIKIRFKNKSRNSYY